MNRLYKIAIAQAICAAINAHGGIGPFGGEAAEYDEGPNEEITFRFATQCCDDLYRVEDDLTITLMNAGEEYERIKSDEGLSDAEMIESCGTRCSYIGSHDHQRVRDFLDELFGSVSEVTALATLCETICDTEKGERYDRV